MKITFTLLLLIATGLFATDANSQMKRVNISMRNVLIKAILDEIENQTDYLFLYSPEEVDIETKTSMYAENMPVAQVLSTLFRNTDISYAMEGNTIFLLKSNPVAADNQAYNQADKISVRGIVNDESGEPVIGANISEKGTTNGTITNVDGQFQLSVSPGATLVVSFIGYKTQEITVGNQTTLNIKLVEDNLILDEVVVVGYGTMRKVSLTSAVGSVDGETIKERPVTDFRSLLQGRLNGLTVTDKGGQPGSQSISLNIRGITSLGNNEPLVIVDGVQQYYSDINPNDVETVSILKDASSTAIYGSRAANGVIMITTKRAETGKVRISYNGYIGFQKSNNIPVHMETEAYMKMQNTAWINTTGSPVYTEEYIKEYVNATDRYKYPLPNTWFDVMLKVAPVHSHTITASGGAENIKSYLSLRYLDQEGILPNYDSKLYDIRLNNDFKVSENLRFSTNLNYRGKDIKSPYTSPVYRMLQNSQWTVPKYPDGTYGISSDGANPLLDAEQSGTTQGLWSYLVGSLNIDLEIFKDLHFTAQLASGLNYGNTKAFANKYEVRDYYNYDIIKKSVSRNSLTEYRDYEFETTVNTLLNYKKQINLSGISALVGYSQIYHKTSNLAAWRYEFYNNSIQSLSQGLDDGTKGNSGSESEWGLRSYFGRINYSYNDRYLFEANGRYDGSSRFYGDNKYSFFPSFSAGWRVSEESFFEGLSDWANELKIRGSYGLTGNQAVGLYSFYDTLNKGTYSFDNTIAQGYYRSVLANKDIHWETTAQTDVGLDLGFINNKITFSADYYKKRTEGILLNLPVPGTLGLSPSVQNAGILDNMGWEFQLGLKHNFGEIGLNFMQSFSANKNVIVDLAGTGPYIYGDSEIRYIVAEGLPYYGFWGYKTGGLFQTEEEVANYPTLQAGTAPGDVKYLDLNNDKIINEEDMTYLGGSFFPKYTFSTDIGLTYKNFSLDMAFQGTAGTKRYIGGAIMQMGIWGGFTHEIFTDNYWTPGNPDARFPRPTKYEVRNTQLSDRNIQDGSYLRLKSAQLSYRIPSFITDKARIGTTSIYLSGTNFLTFSKLNEWDVDPESDNRDPEWNYPQTSVISVGLSINF
ncbi:MAG: TonB-dependent receptor [Tannerella sp.]|nr:TonB-dependent receptor [Tannerella sp.]